MGWEVPRFKNAINVEPRKFNEAVVVFRLWKISNDYEIQNRYRKYAV